MRTRGKGGGAALLIVAAAYTVTWVLEIHRESLGFGDADNPVTMMAFLRTHPHVYTWSGIAFVVMAVALVIAVLSVFDVLDDETDPVVLRAVVVMGLFAAAYFFAQGVLRVQSPGTLIHMAGMRPEFGHAAFLAVQMAGTQGFASAGGWALSIWAVGVSLVGLRGGRVPRLVAVLAAAPAIQLLVGLFGPLFDPLPGAVYLLYVATIPGVLAWCVAMAVVLLRRTTVEEAPDHAGDG